MKIYETTVNAIAAGNGHSLVAHIDDEYNEDTPVTILPATSLRC